MPVNSKDLFKKNMLDRYIDRPDKIFRRGNYQLLDEMCYVEFLSNYSLENLKTNQCNDSQPEILDDLLRSSKSVEQSDLPKSFPLMSSKESLKLRKAKCILRYHIPIQTTQPEEYAHQMLFMFFPFRNESDLKAAVSRTYSEKLLEPTVIEIVNRNRKACEPFEDAVDEAFIDFIANPRGMNPQAEQENEDVGDEIIANATISDETDNNNKETFCGTQVTPVTPLISDEALGEKIRSLNKLQREIFDFVNKWARDQIKSKNCKALEKLQPIHLFITGSAGTEKSLLLATIRHFLVTSLSYNEGPVDQARVLMLAPTGVAAVNVDGATIHSTLALSPKRNYSKGIPKLSDKKQCMLQNKYSQLLVIIIDEISMVSNKLLLNVHKRLVEIFGCSPDIPFAGISVIACGDFYQLPSIQQRPVYAKFDDVMLNISHCWRLFKIAELTELMRQRGDWELITLLINIRTGNIIENDEKILKSKFIEKSDHNYCNEAFRIWAENDPVEKHNKKMLDSLPGAEYMISAVDKMPGNISEAILEKIYSLSQMKTGGLAHKLTIKLQAKIILTSNIDVSDKLCNGQIGTIHHLKQDSNGNVTTVYLKMDDESAGLQAIRSNTYGSQHNLVPIRRIEREIAINSKSTCSLTIKRLQFPIILYWASTIHKVQRKTFQKVVVCFYLFKQRTFNPGQIYVALSRVTSLDGLYLTVSYNRKALKVDQRATEQYEYMRKTYQFQRVEDDCSISDNSLVVTLLNVRSLRKHGIDVPYDKSIMESDIIAFTETQLSHDCTSLDQDLHPLTLITNNLSQNSYSNVAFAHRDTLSLLNVENALGATFLPINSLFLEVQQIFYCCIVVTQ